MSSAAIVMMLVAMAVIWGGLVLAILRLRGTGNPGDLHRDL